MSNTVNISRSYSAMVARRGKGATGTVEIQTFGKPVKVKGEPAVKEFDYSEYAKLGNEIHPEVLAAIQKVTEDIGNINECLLEMADNFLRSSSRKAKSVIGIWSAAILDKELAKDEKTAENIVKGWIRDNETMKRYLLPVLSFETHFERLEKAVEKQKAEAEMAPRLKK